ncbi:MULTISPECIES: metal ABC transporter solute-binding protein, Zn/Mn family [unclassified Mycobacterium]|uniref:metal ABC transporter solute-binding protein, Zn/Mn family n=1 Tax=unclassified Mycobacterium TaxID=2642494 RepID=UPI0029C62258|nr:MULTISPECIES: zinc ABC transporter substrate-binding protein [unclassified Mycobacterium]
MSITTTRRRLAAAVLLAAPLFLAACSDGGDERTASQPSAAAPCPTTPVDVVVSVDQWGDIVSELGGACAKVTTLLASSSVDPHDYEPSPADAAKFEGARLVVVNGGHYDEWATKLAAGSAPDAPVVDAAKISGGDEHGEANPHIWYLPAAVKGVADAVTARLTELAPDAKAYFADRRRAFADALGEYDRLIASIKASASGKTYAATESVFDYMAAAVGLQNETPQGYQNATSNESDPSPADLDAFLGLLRTKGVDVLIYNTQTEGSVPAQLRSAAEAAGVPVVEVTETVAPGADSFEAWQVDQLKSLAKALGVAG